MRRDEAPFLLRRFLTRRRPTCTLISAIALPFIRNIIERETFFTVITTNNWILDPNSDKNNLQFTFSTYYNKISMRETSDTCTLAVAADVTAGGADGVAIVGDVARGRGLRHREGGVVRHLES